MHFSSARVMDADPGNNLSAPGLDDSDWLAVDVPGDLHTALVRAGRLPDLDHGLNSAAASWVEDREWWYRLYVPGPGQLVCHGLDTFATVYFDGKVVGESRNMFRPFTFDAESPGVLAVCFHRPLDRAPGVARMRKAQYQYGWDFAPRRPTVGVWRPVTLSKRSSITGVRFTTVRVDPVEVRVEVQGPVGEFRVHVAGAAATGVVGEPLSMVVDAPLWTTSDPVLHDLTISLPNGEVHVEKVGLRTIAVDRTDGFRFVLNGKPICVRGVNWVPCHTALGDITADRYRALLSAAKDAHMNMVRVWGGGVYEHDAFYDLCDELGLLVWQDFMFAGAPYADPAPDFVTEVELEARYQVRRLRNRPSTALWCGNNEVEVMAELLGWEKDPFLFHDLLPRVVSEEDGVTAYLPTSPTAGADRHNWHVWHGVAEPIDHTSFATELGGPAFDPASDQARQFVELAHPRQYLLDDSAFVSEYGLCGTATYQTLQHWTDPEDLHLGAPAIEARTVPGRLGPRNKLELLVRGIVGVPRSLRHWIALSHLLQAEGVKTGTEHYRRRWPSCGGSLLWQLNDCWPSTSWALIDIDGRRKPAFQAAATAFAPVLLSFTPDGTLWVSTDVDVGGAVVVRARTFSGETLMETSLHVEAAAGSSRAVARFPVGNPFATYLTVEGLGVRNRQLFADVARLRRPTAHVEVKGRRVTATAYAFQVQTDAGECFDLEAGETREVADTNGLYWL